MKKLSWTAAVSLFTSFAVTLMLIWPAPELTFKERWPTRDTLIRWEFESIVYTFDLILRGDYPRRTCRDNYEDENRRYCI